MFDCEDSGMEARWVNLSDPEGSQGKIGSPNATTYFGRKVDPPNLLWSKSGPPLVGKWTTLIKSFGFMPNIMSIVVTSIMLSVQNGVMDIIRFPLVFL